MAIEITRSVNVKLEPRTTDIIANIVKTEEEPKKAPVKKVTKATARK